MKLQEIIARHSSQCYPFLFNPRSVAKGILIVGFVSMFEVHSFVQLYYVNRLHKNHLLTPSEIILLLFCRRLFDYYPFLLLSRAMSTSGSIPSAVHLI